MDGWLATLKALATAWLSARSIRWRILLGREAQRLWDVALCTGLALVSAVLGVVALGAAAWMATPEAWRPTLLGISGVVLCGAGAGLARAARRRLSAPAPP
jgi:hypothetical protein